MTRKTRQRYIADTETTTTEYSENETHVWAWAAQKIGDDATQYGNCIDTLMAQFETVQGDYYFHNLAFDGEFIVSWLLNHGWTYSDNKQPKTFNAVISQLGRWYTIQIIYARKGNKIKSTKLFDSLKKLPFSVKQVADAFNIPEKKLTLDYDQAWKNPNWIEDANTKEYISHDVTIVNKALKTMFDEGLEKMTIGGDAMFEYKNIIGSKVFDQLFPN
jgi:hypothetical protein